MIIIMQVARLYHLPNFALKSKLLLITYRDLSLLLFSLLFSFPQDILKRAGGFDELSDYVDVAVVFKGLYILYDVWMVHHRQSLYLTPNILCLRPRHQLLQHDLDCILLDLVLFLVTRREDEHFAKHALSQDLIGRAVATSQCCAGI